jgi:poly(A) polymerase
LISSLRVLRARIRNLSVIQKLAGAGFAGRAYLVGGAIRELALGGLPRDYDFALEQPDDLPIMERVFEAKAFLLGKKPIQTHRIVSHDVTIDLTFIKDGIAADLARRDFTMNAIGYEVGSGELLDPFGGLQDIKYRRIRSPREGALCDDPLRMVKAVRHASTLKGFFLDNTLLQTIRVHRQLLHSTAPERIKYELDLIMVSGDVHHAMKLMQETGVLFELFPELRALKEMDEEKAFDLETLGHTLDGFAYLKRAGRLHGFSERDKKYATWGLLFHDLGKAYTFSYDEAKGRVHFFYHERHSSEIAGKIMERLRFSAVEVRSISTLIAQHMRLFLISNREATERATRRAVYKLEDLIPSLVLLTLLDMYGSSGGKENATTRQVKRRCREVLDAYDEWRREPLSRLVTGYDLLQLGFTEGPVLGRVLNGIREKQIAGDIKTREEALSYAKKALDEEQKKKTGDQ